MASAARRTDEARDRPLSISEFQELPEEDAYRIELVRGRLVREPRPMPLHGRVQTVLAHLLMQWVEAKGDGVVLTDAGFVVEHDPPTVRGPDVAWVSAERIPAGAYEGGYWHLGPDLAVEVVSPSNTAGEIEARVREYLAAGTRLVWVVDPRRRSVTVHDAAEGVRVVEAGGVLAGRDGLPGLSLPLDRLFAL